MADPKPPVNRKPVRDPLEARRLEQPCLRTIDLRPERGKRCRAYPHGGRTHWLDDAAIAAFEQALTAYNGRYTIGVYEQTLASDSQTTAPLASQREVAVAAEEKIRRIPFGYRPHRHESRMNYVSAVTLEIDSGNSTNRLAGKTLDLSLLGVRVQIAPEHKLSAQTDVLLHYDELQQRAGEPLGSIAYRVLGCEREGDRQIVRLKRLMRGGEHAFDTFVPGFIEQQLARYKMELKDALPATYARIYERLYSQSVWYGQAYFSAATAEAPRELLFVTTAANWQREHNLQALPRVAEKLAAGLPASSSRQSLPQLHYWLHSVSGDYVVPAAALTATRRESWLALSPHAIALAVICQPQRPLDPALAQPFLELLPDELASVVLGWQQRLQQLDLSASIVPLAPLPSEPYPHPLPDWLREFALVPDRLQAPGECAPLTAMGLRGARKQERFRYQTPVLLRRENGTELAGESIDFSINGLGLELHSDSGLSARELLQISFPVLQQKVKEPDELADQPYRVVRQLGRHLTLERDFRVVGHRAARFFAHIIQQNRGRLPACHSEQQETAESQLSEQVLVHGISASPLFFARDEDKHPQLLALAHQHGQPPASPFAGDDGRSALAALADLPVLYDVLANCCNAVGAVERVTHRRLLLQTQPTVQWQVLTADTPASQLRALLQQGCRLFALILTPVPGLPVRELNDALLPILGNSRHRATAFRSELNRLVGIGSLFEVTEPAQAALGQGLTF
ncbi:MAG TPA: PilZ domain-containing protein [Permianibacter sp.]|nr:PilZ domain-containing protein [Permianibacter sp.]